MDKKEVSGFIRFLEEATIPEIEKSKAEMKSLLRMVDGNVAADVKFCLRLVDQELLARSELIQLHQR